MSRIDPKQVREWKAGYEAMNRFVDEERRNATYRERFASLVAIWRQAALLGHLTDKPLDLSVNDKWQLLRKAHFKRSA